MISVCNVIIKSLILRSCVKMRILHSGLMNARLSVHCSLKRAKRRDYRLCTLKRAAPAQHVLKYSYSPEWNPMLFFTTIVTLTKPQCQETNVHYILKWCKWNA